MNRKYKFILSVVMIAFSISITGCQGGNVVEDNEIQEEDRIQNTPAKLYNTLPDQEIQVENQSTENQNKMDQDQNENENKQKQTQKQEKQNTENTDKFSININTSALKLELYKNGEKIKTYDVAAGKSDTPTPKGTYEITEKQKNPGGPYGTRWMGLSVPGGKYGIHGTNNPNSIGNAVSHGCIRMNNESANDLFNIVPVGTTVKIS